jgi:hypothetical protein
MLRRLLRGCALLASLLLFAPLGAQEQQKPAAAAKTKTIDLVICLDVSNSMDGLIDSAKRKLWDIVNEVGRAKPTPKLRVALYSYGNDGYDPKTGWVVKDLDLTNDLDKVSEKLFALRTNGGTEYVGRVTQAALTQLDWSKEPGALKIIFVCGNEPATQDPEVQLKPLAERMIHANVIVNTIYCGDPRHSEAAGWKQYADWCEGKFMAINQSGAIAIATPYDKELADLSTQLNRTYLWFGKEGKSKASNQVMQDSNAATAGGGVAAQRAQSKAGANYRVGACLVERLEEDKNFDVTKVPVEDLPEEMKKMTPEERVKYVKDKLAEREKIRGRINEVGKKQREHIEVERKKVASKGEKALDEAIKQVVREQCHKKGIEIPN